MELEDKPKVSARIVLTRYAHPAHESVEVEECYGENGMPLPVSDALGLLRLGADVLLDSHLREGLEHVRALMLGDVTDEWDAERDATIIAYITELLDVSPNAA